MYLYSWLQSIKTIKLMIVLIKYILILFKIIKMKLYSNIIKVNIIFKYLYYYLVSYSFIKLFYK